ncbi:DUF2314 domain-containing protein [Plantactinospora sp. KBS50]|uniref:DUF2314 domain-containing protein n=1 Tax=Plantactinospora sp. KBS50 TaxID=2024580 RepID=UPI000BAABB6C|nr:DUF2314 domain-containing protein [Plantactinospora sp. KBS50]ASW56101.1 DUF2314 domain-containing protein [Plantactinospora sp. KBS50]
MTITDDFLPVPVPESLTATYLVPVPARPADPAAALAALAPRLAAPIRDLAQQMLAGPLLTVQTRSVDELPHLPPDLLAAFGAADDQLSRLSGATELMVVQAEFRPGWPPAHEWAARAVAAALAEAMGGDVVDVFGFQLLDPAAAVRSLPDEEGRIRLVDWILVPYSDNPDGLWFTTKGLRRFGLLELQAQGVPAALTRAWAAVMTGVARRLLRTWTDKLGDQDLPAFVQLPVMASVTSHDIAVAYGNPERHDGSAPARLRLELDPATDPEAESFLSLLPPEGHPGPAGRYFATVCATLFGSERTEIRHTRTDEAMIRAIATARSGLPGVRERFRSRALPEGTRLMVKYGLPGPDGPEYVWAEVTSWLEPERILGTSASDAANDDAVRAGRPVAVNAVDVVDWALLHGARMVEGGWTQAVLDNG